MDQSLSVRLDKFLEKLDFPMFIVTAAALSERSGCLVGFITQSSIKPVRFLVCISEKNHTYRIAAAAPVLAVHLIPKSASELVRLFGSETGDEIDKFAHCKWSAGPEGVPLLESCPSRMVCRVVRWLTVGDHGAFLVEPIDAEVGDEPIFTLGMSQAQKIEPGHPA
jgi:flavin reductase (DIM6/NTAB) family NADH-FMN oxidoreductase RutF